MKSKMYWGVAILIILLIGVSVFMLMRNTDTDPKVIYKVDVAPEKQTEETEAEDTASVETEAETEVAEESAAPADAATSKSKTEYATEPVYAVSERGSTYPSHIPRDPDRFAHLPAPPLPPSAVPEDCPEPFKQIYRSFAGIPSAVPEDCPEHLKLLPEWIDGVYHGTEPPPADWSFTEEVAERMRDILLEIVGEHNPKRPYTEIWDQYIEYEKMYRAYAEWELGYTPSGNGSGARLDWVYEQTWAFPEFAELLMSEDNRPHGEENRFVKAYEVAMGRIEPGWNKFTLKDGRDFFIKGRSRYEFFYSGVTEDGDKWYNTSRFARVPSWGDYPTVRIDVLNTSDEDLEAQMGWDYTINPFTLRPLVHEGLYPTIYPRMIEAIEAD